MHAKLDAIIVMEVHDAGKEVHDLGLKIDEMGTLTEMMSSKFMSKEIGHGFRREVRQDAAAMRGAQLAAANKEMTQMVADVSRRDSAAGLESACQIKYYNELLLQNHVQCSLTIAAAAMGRGRSKLQRTLR